MTVPMSYKNLKKQQKYYDKWNIIRMFVLYKQGMARVSEPLLKLKLLYAG